MTAEQIRVERNDRGEEQWDLWGPYVSERAWGTVREDYSAEGDAWNYFPHDHARSRVYRWSEDGIAGISDFKQRLCFAFAFWNERDPILKERFFGLTGPQGNHGEDVKEVYFYDDNTPSHSYMRMTYRYARNAFPSDRIVAENARRTRDDAEFEISDTGVFDHGFFEIQIEYAKRLAARSVDPRHDHEQGRNGSAAACFADALVPQHMELGPRRSHADAARGRQRRTREHNRSDAPCARQV